MNATWRGLVAMLAVLVLASLGLAACGDDDDEAEGDDGGATTFVGRVVGTQLAVAAVVEGDRALIYVCDGQNGRRIDAVLKDGAYSGEVAGLGKVSVQLHGSAVTGNVETGGKTYSFKADEATGKAVLLWATGERTGTAISAGWIVAADGGETGGVVRGITDGTSNLVAVGASALPHIEQDNIIAILIGIRSPLRAPAPAPSGCVGG